MKLSDFNFYNKHQKILSPEILDDLNERRKNNPSRAILYTNRDYCEYGIYFSFIEDEIEIKKSSYLKTPEQINNNMFLLKEHFICNFDICEHDFKDFFSNLQLPEEDNFLKFNCADDFLKFFFKLEIIQKHEIDIENYKELFENFIKNNMFIEKYSELENVEQILNVNEIVINDIEYGKLVFSRNTRYGVRTYYNFIPKSCTLYNYYDVGNLKINEYFVKAENAEIFTNERILDKLSKEGRRFFGENNFWITEKIYNFYAARYDKFENDRHYIRKNIDPIKQKICDKYDEAFSNGKKFVYSGVIFEKNKISLVDNEFSFTFNDDMFKNHSISDVLFSIDENTIKYNFEQLFKTIIKCSKLRIVNKDNCKEYQFQNFEQCNFNVNGIDISIQRHKESGTWYINDIDERISDIIDLIHKVLCFNSLDDYNMYLKDVSYIGLDLKSMIGTGVCIELKNPLFYIFRSYSNHNKEILHIVEEMILRLNLFWDTNKRNNVYMSLNGEKYLIKDKGVFKREFDKPTVCLQLDELRNIFCKCLKDFPLDRMNEVVENAYLEARIVQERGLALLKATLLDVGAKEGEIEVQGSKHRGYEIIGNRTGRRFFIDRLNIDVYRFDNGYWNRRCVISDPNKNRIFEDRFANRLINIFNENKNISTIQ